MKAYQIMIEGVFLETNANKHEDLGLHSTVYAEGFTPREAVATLKMNLPKNLEVAGLAVKKNHKRISGFAKFGRSIEAELTLICLI